MYLQASERQDERENLLSSSKIHIVYKSVIIVRFGNNKPTDN